MIFQFFGVFFLIFFFFLIRLTFLDQYKIPEFDEDSSEYFLGMIKYGKASIEYFFFPRLATLLTIHEKSPETRQMNIKIKANTANFSESSS